MKQKIFLVLMIITLALLITACQQKAQTPETTSPEPSAKVQKQDLPTQEKMKTAPPQHPAIQSKTPATLSIPEEIQGKWDSVTLMILDKKKGTEKEETLPLHSEFAVPNSPLTVKVGDFVPDFTMDMGVISSKSNEPKNPAFQITILEEGKEIYKGWLFQRFPEMHPFQDERIKITLAGYQARK